MIWLYDKNEQNIQNYNGVPLSQAYDDKITHQLNGVYKLEFKHPITEDIRQFMQLKANEQNGYNSFVVYEVVKYAKHLEVVAYQSSIQNFKRKIRNFSVVNVHASTAVNSYLNSFVSPQNLLITAEVPLNKHASFTTIKESSSDKEDTSLKDAHQVLLDLADTYQCDLYRHFNQVKLIYKMGRWTEYIYTTNKNISDFVTTENSDEIITRIHATVTYKPDIDKEAIKEQQKAERQAVQARYKAEAEQRNNAKRQQRMQDEINSKYRNQYKERKQKGEREYKSYEQITSEVQDKYNRQATVAAQRRAESQRIADAKKSELAALKARQKDEYSSLNEEITINLVVDSPLINDYPFINETVIEFKDARSAHDLYEMAMEQFNKYHIDKPKKSHELKNEDVNVDLVVGDKVIVRYLLHGVDEEQRIVETQYSPMSKKLLKLIVGEKQTNLSSQINSSTNAMMNDKFSIATSEYEANVKLLADNFIENMNKDMTEIAQAQADEIEKIKAANEVDKANWHIKFNEKLEPFRQEARQSIEQLNQRANQLYTQLSSVEQRANTNVANAISQFNTNKEAIDTRLNAVINIFNSNKASINNDLSNLRLNLDNRLAEMSTQSSTMLNDIANAKRKLAEADSKFVSNAILEQTVDEISQELQQISNMNNSTEEKFSSYKQNIEGKFEKIGNLIETSNGTLTSKINEAKSTAEQFTRDIRMLTTDLNVTKSNLNSVVATSSQQSTKISDLTSKLNATNSKVSEVVQTATEHTSKLSELNRKDTELQSQVNTVKQTVSEQSTSISNVNSRLNVTNTDLSNVSQTARAIETALTSGVTGNDIPTKINKFIEKKTAEGIYTTLSNNVGGRNYIRDYSMKNLITKFMKLGSNVDWRFEAIQDHTAKSGYHIKATCIRTATGANGFHYPLVDLRNDEFQGKQMTWSIDIKSNRNLNFYHIGFEANGLRSADVTTNWQRVTKTFNVNFVKFWSFVFYSNQIQSGDVIYIRDAQLEDGVIATTARAAEDDFKSELAEYKQTATINSAKLSDVITKANATATNLTTVEQTATRTLEELSTFKQTVNAAGYVNQTSMNNAIANTANGLRQEISRVEQSIDTKGFITSTIANQLVNVKADEYSRELTTVKKLIPKDFSGNLLLDSARNWTATSYFQVTYQLSEPLQKGQVYTVALKWTLNNERDRGLYRPMVYCRGGLLGLTGPLDAGKPITMYDSESGVWIATFKVPLKSQMTTLQRQKFEESPNFIEIYRWGSSTNVNRNDSRSNASVTCEFATLVKGGIALSKWQKSWSELDSNLTTLNTFKQNSEGTLLRYETTNNEQNRKIASLESGMNGINLSVQTVSNKVATVTNNLNNTNTNLNNLANQVVKHSEVNVTDAGVSIGSKQILNGQTLTSMITVNPNNVKVITDNMVLTNQSNNLLSTIDSNIYCNKRDTTSNIIISEKIKNGDKFLLKFKGYKQTSHRVNVLFYITYTDNTNAWLPIRIDDKPVVRNYDGRSYYDFETDYTLAGLDNSKTVRDFRMGYQIDTRSNFGTLYVEHAELYQKRDANLLVDGSITAKQLNVNEIFANTAVINNLKSKFVETTALNTQIVNIAERLIIGDASNPSVIFENKGTNFIKRLRSDFINSAYINTLELNANVIKNGITSAINGRMSTDYNNGDVSYYSGKGGYKIAATQVSDRLDGLVTFVRGAYWVRDMQRTGNNLLTLSPKFNAMQLSEDDADDAFVKMGYENNDQPRKVNAYFRCKGGKYIEFENKARRLRLDDNGLHCYIWDNNNRAWKYVKSLW